MRSILLVGLLFLACGCSTTTSLVSIANETYVGKEYTSIIVSAPYDDLETKDYIERLFQMNLFNVNLKVYRAIDVLPPLRTYSVEEIQDSLERANIQAMLVIGVVDFWRTYMKMPDKSVTATKTSGTESQSKTTYLRGITLSHANVKLDVRLLKFNRGVMPETIWRSSSTTSGNFFTKDSKVMRDAARRISEELHAKHLLKSAPRDKQTPKKKIVLMGGPHSSVSLGCISCKTFDLESVYNGHGYFGARAEESIWHPCGPYASATSDYSACNMDAAHPPIIVDQLGNRLGILSLGADSTGYKVRKLKKWLENEICGKCESDSKIY